MCVNCVKILTRTWKFGNTSMHIVLVHPEIPPNTGNVARLCAATGTTLHLVRPLGFSLDDRYLKRAGLDYWPWLKLEVHAGWEEFRQAHPDSGRYLLFSKKAQPLHWSAPYQPDSYLIFGCETRGLPDTLLGEFPLACHRIPIPNPNVRSLNLSTAVGIVAYEAFRQTGVLGAG